MPEYNFTFDWNRITTIGKVKILAEQVVGNPSQEDIDQAVAQYIEDHPGSISGLSEAAKVALLQIAQKIAYIDEHGQDYYDALYDALYPPAELVGITAVYTQSGTVYDTDSLESLEADLVVTANYSDGTSEVITSGYTLSGTLTAGTSTITVSYQGQTTTFTVTVTHEGRSDMDGWTDGVAYTDLDIYQNQYFAANTGAINNYNGWDRTGYVPCDGCSSITFPPMTGAGSNDLGSNRFFDANYAMVGGREDFIKLSATESKTIAVPATAVYFGLSSKRAPLAACIAGGIVPHA